MDEADSPPLHRWLSFCRLLMFFHPRVGAQNYARHLGAESEFKPGWNAVHRAAGAEIAVNYILIGKDGGRNTEQKPDVPDTEIHHVYEDELPQYAGSLAFRRITELADLVVKQRIKGYGKSEVAETMVSIEAASHAPLRGPTASVGERTDREVDRLKQGIAAKVSPRDLARPLVDVVHDALRFRLSGTHAANVLSSLLLHYMRLPSPLERKFLPELISDNVDHLINRVLALKADRQLLKLTPYCQATYLALLYADAALLTCKEASSHLPEGMKLRVSFERRGLYVDEVAAHELAPCLMHPVDLMPFGVPEFMHAAGQGIIDAGGIYAGAGGQDKGPVADVAATAAAIKAYSAAAKDADILASIEAQNSPLSEEDHQRIAMFLLTMQLGRGR
jgi:hypothetical protein